MTMWIEPDALPPLDSSAGVHLWLLDTSQSVPDMALLSEEERCRCWRFQSDALRNRFVVVHGVLRLLLGHYLNLPPQRITFVSNSYGKLALDRAGLQFNLSYSQHLALLGFTRNGAIGVDIERIQPIDEMEAIAALCFSPDEQRVWHQLQPAERLHVFYGIWTRKEAVIKALGMGLSYPLQQFTVLAAPCTIKIEEQPLLLLDIVPNDLFAAALAVEAPAVALKCWRWKP